VASDISKYTAQRKEKGLSTYYSPQAIAEKVKLEKKARTGVQVPWPTVTKDETEAYKRYSSNNALNQDDVVEVKDKTSKEKTYKTIGEKREAESWTSVGAAIENWWEGDADKAYIPFEDERKQVIKEATRANKKYTPEQINALAERKYQHREYGKLINKKAEQYLKDISGDEQDLLESKAKKETTIEQRNFDKKSAVNKMLSNDLQGYSKAFDAQLKDIEAYGKTPKFTSQEELNAYNEKVNNVKRIQQEATNTHSAYMANLEEYDKSSKKLGKAEDEFDLAKRHYGAAWEFTKIVPAVENFVEGAVGFVSMIADTGVWAPQKLASMITGGEAPEFLSDTTKSILRFKREREEIQQGFYARPREIENAETFFEKGWDLVATQIPNIALMALTMGTGGAEIAAAEVATEVAVAEGAASAVGGIAGKTIAGETVGAIAEKQAIDKAVKITSQEAIEAAAGKISNSAKWLETIKANPIGKKIIEAGTLEGIAPKVIAGSSAGTKFLDLADTNDQGVTNYDPLQMVASSLLYGYAEGVGENVTMDIFKGAVRPLQALAKDGGKKAFLDTLKKDTIGAWLGKRGTDMLNENVSEQVTNLAQNAIDKFMLNKNVGLLDNTAAVFKDTTLLTSLMIGVPHIGGLVIKPFVPVSDQSKMKDNSSQIAMLMHKMNTPGINEATLSAYKAKAATLTQANSDITNKTIQRVGGMPNTTFDNILNLDKTRRDIQVKAHEVINGSGTQEQKAEALSIFEQEYNAADNELAVIHNNIKMMDTISNDYTPEDRKDIYNLLVEHKDLSEKMKSMDPMQKQEATDKIKEINDNFIAHNIRLNVEKAIAKDANNALKAKEALGLDKLEVLSFDNSDDLEDWFTINAPLSKEEAADMTKDKFNKTKADNYSEWVGEQSNKYGIFVPRKDGTTVLIINKELSAQKGVVTTGQHEFLHALIYNAVKGNPEFAKKMGTDLYNFLESSIGKEVLEGTEFKKRHDGYKDDFIEEKKSFEEQQKAEIEKANKETNGVGMTRTAADIRAKYSAKINQAEANYLEETLTLLSEAISKGDIKYNETFFTKLGDFIRRVFQNYGIKVSFATGQDVFNFVRDYNKSYEKGKFTDAFKALAVKGEYKGPKQTDGKAGDLSIKSSSNPKVDEIQKKIDKLEEQYDNGQIEYDYYENQIGLYKDELKKAKLKPEGTQPAKAIVSKEVTEEDEVTEIIKNEKGTLSSDKVQKIYETKGINGAQDIIDLFKPITNRIVDKRRDAPGFEKKLLTDEIETGEGGILYLIKSYKPEKGIPLAAYINKQLPLRAIAASRRVLDVQFNKDATEEVGLMATETADQNMVERVAEKPKYKNALEANVFEPAVIESIKGKILSTLRLLKNRIDATVTLNRTVTPIVAEIRDEMGKQADIDIKTAMGGKKDGQLKSFLLKNKRYILENMTTTWLMGKDGQGGMPIAIQKRINGRWTNFPDWVGQKIDRESTSTDLAGRTSGTELARRLPNVNANISNEDFLAQVLGSDGNPLRGRKESLAKAMAEEISFELISKDLADKGPLYEALEANQTRLEAKLNSELDIEFNKQIERGNIKNSNEIKEKSRRLRNGLEISKRKLESDIDSAGNNPDLIAKNIMKWLANDGRAIRTKSWQLSYVSKFYTTNSNLLSKILYPILERLSYKFMIDKEDYFNLVDVPTGKKVYFGNEPIKLWMQTEDLKNNWEKLNPGAMEESTYALDDLVDTIKWCKANLNEEEFSDYILLLSEDQRGLVRKVSSPGLGFLNLTKGQKPWLEHNPPRLNIVDDINSLYNSNISTSDVKNFKAKIGKYNVNLIPKALNELLPKYEDGKNRMRDKDVLLYIDNAIKNGANITGFGAEYGSKENFDSLVALAKEGFDTNQIANETNTLNALALYGIKSSNQMPKGISVFDFDDTSAFTSGSVLYTMPDGLKGKLNAEEFAKEGSYMLDAGAIFDFSEFSKVVDGKPGPMVEKMKKMIAKFGNENFFILTARPANAAGPIKEFLDSIGIDIPLENITGLGNSTAQAKADWIVGKVAEGYNDFYFTDDAIQNVEAVKNALAVFDVKSKIQQARIKSSKKLSEDFNKIIEVNTGMADFKVFSDIVAKRRGAGKGKYRFFLPPSAEDFTGLLYDFLGKGKVGEEQFDFFKKNLIDPYVAGSALIDSARQSIKRDYKALLSAFPEVRKKLGKKIPDGDFTYDQAIRVSAWVQSGVEVPGLSQRDANKLNDLVNNDPQLASFKDNLIITGRQADGWIAPTEFWDADTIISDLHNITEKVGRKKFLAEFIENVGEIFSKENLNKIEAVYGSNFREALEDSIYRMSNGTNRPSGSNRLTNQWNNWVNNSTGAIMFFNTRSALLQVISGMNFLNWSDNNPASAALAFADQKQYWKDFSYIFNSDKMKERRSGLKEDVSAAEIANAAEGSKNKVGAVLSYLLKLGFTPTQIADSFAISAGGSTFYRNRIKTYIKKGMSETEAEVEAWKDFSKTADENQQSSDPMLISQQQTSSIGRLILAFQNTPMQYNRLIKKAARDLINRRGNSAEHISKILYYGAVQSFIFNALQSALFAVAFSGGDDEEKEKEINKKSSDIVGGMIDGIVRGSGLGGAIVVTLKNAIEKYQEESEKGFKGDNAKVLLQLLNISPAIGSKASKIYGSMQTAIFEKEVVKEMGWSVTRDGRINISPNYEIAGSLIEGTTNIPMNRLVSKVENMSEALDSRNATWQRIASALGWKPYTIGVVNEEQDLIKAGAKVRKKAEGKEKSKLTRLENKLKELDRMSNMTTEEYDQYIRVKKLENKEKYLDRKLKKLQEAERLEGFNK
jgi:hypothetical protein